MQTSSIPRDPYSTDRVISAKVGPEFHKQVREFAAQKDCSVAAVIKYALESVIQQQGRP